VNPFIRFAARWSSATPADAAAPALRGDALPPGTVLGGVTLVRPIGRGATAVVYGGLDNPTQTPRAVKVWSPQAGTDADDASRQRFLQEAQHAAGLEHPGIVRIFGGGSQTGLAFIVMELITGSTLARYADAAHRLPEPLVLEIAAQLAEALAHAHRQGVVHRDVKPSNALFDPATRRVALTDFGLARAPDAQASRSGVFMGSPVYMAPELLAGQPPDARSDLYALGVLTYELLAGRPPFEATSMGALLRAVAQSLPAPLAALRGDGLPAAAAEPLDRLLAPLLAKAPAQRPSNGDDWAATARQTAQWLMSAANATNAPRTEKM
jgi:eukaryotic-like serine/threonine-protein kinase